jgi:ABC-type Fe3+-siderophore transport system permease subunit
MELVAVGVGLLIANMFGQASMIMLVLGGMISAALFTSALSIVKYTADPYEQLPAIVYWLMGALKTVSRAKWARLIPPPSIYLCVYIKNSRRTMRAVFARIDDIGDAVNNARVVARSRSMKTVIASGQ